MDRITTDLERKMDRQLCCAIAALHAIEEGRGHPRMIARAALDQMEMDVDPETLRLVDEALKRLREGEGRVG